MKKGNATSAFKSYGQFCIAFTPQGGVKMLLVTA